MLESGSCPGFGSTADKYYRCDVIFGSPSADCRGTGICKIVAQHRRFEQPEQQQCQRTGAMFAYSSLDQSFSMLLFPEFMCIKLLRNHLRHGVLEMLEPARLPAEMVALLGLSAHAIPPGKYPIEIKMGYFQIKFPKIKSI
ncbi:MAG: hypothetical protein IPL65_07540 [Lewinellaceae bacterium]|nr:hypothetical protein [Lewinellaceae bacterium]